jgi:hypothetical protein
LVHSTGNDNHVRRLLPALLAASLTLACNTATGAATPSPSPSPSASPTAPPVVVGAPAALILDGPEAGLAPAGGRDHLDLAQAASLEQNQPLALTRYRSWGWVDQATRSWGGSPPRLRESLLLLTRAEGARQAFSDLISAGLVTPAPSAPCPPGLGLDECAQGQSADDHVLVGRLDRYLVRFDGPGIDLGTLAALQATRLRG